MSLDAKRTSIIFAILQGAFWCSNCMLYGFLVNILTDYGFSTMMSGVTLTLIALITIVVQPLLGYISDTFVTGKKLLILCLSVAAIISLGLPKLIAGPQWLAIVAIAVLSVFDYSVYTVIDVWAIKTIADNPGMDFAIVRSGGSVSYAVAALVMGKAIVFAGIKILFTGHFISLVISVIVALMLKEYPCLNSKKYPGSALVNAPSGDTLFSALKQLMANKKYVIATLTLALYQVCGRVTQSYLAVVIEHFGGTSSDMGLTLFIGAATEVVVMIAVGKMISNGASLTYLYMTFTLIMAARMACLLIPGGVMVPMLSQSIQAVAVGIYLRVFPDYISSITPPNLTATACTFAIAISMGGGSVPGNLLGGWLIEDFGMNTYFVVAIIIGVLAFISFFPNVIEEYNRSKIENTKL